MTFTELLWESIEPTYNQILKHPFIHGLTSGELDEEAFRFYVIQDAIYLKDFGRGLALLGARSENDNDLMMFCEHAKTAIVVERELHKSFIEAWGLSWGDIEKTEPSPNCLLYTSYLLRVVYSRPYYEALGAFLPCYWIYREVGKALVKQSSPHALYQRWIDTYAGEEFALTVRDMLATVEDACSSLSAGQKERVANHFRITSKFEYLFWDMGYHRQKWPL